MCHGYLILTTLQALKFLHEKGLPYGHLHAGNVILEGNACRLLDIENTLLGLPFFYRGYLSHFRKINVSMQWIIQIVADEFILHCNHKIFAVQYEKS